MEELRRMQKASRGASERHIDKLEEGNWEESFDAALREENKRSFKATQHDIREMVKLRDRLPADDQMSRALIGECIELQMESLRDLQRMINGKA